MERIGIVCAMEEEVAQLAAQLTQQQTRSLAGTRLHQGQWHRRECVVMKSGLGKVAAAASVQAMISHCQVKALIVVGLAGAVDPTLAIGDVVIGERLIQHDLDVRPLFDYPLIPDLGVRWLETDVRLRERAQQTAQTVSQDRLRQVLGTDVCNRFEIYTPTVRMGLILTGDQFIAGDQVGRLRQVFPEALCVEMEGAAVGQVCAMNRVPFIVIRIISDRADHSAKIDFTRFLHEVASPYSFALVDALLQQLTP